MKKSDVEFCTSSPNLEAVDSSEIFNDVNKFTDYVLGNKAHN